MVNRDRKIKEQVEQTMRALDGIERAKTEPFFYERLEAKLEKRGRERMPWFVAAAAVIGFLVLFNVFTVLQYGMVYEETEDITEQSEESLELVWDYESEIIVSEYDFIENYEITGRD